MDADEALIYDFTYRVAGPQRVTDATYARAVQRFGEQGAIDMIGVAGFYTFHCDGAEHRAHAAAPGRAHAETVPEIIQQKIRRPGGISSKEFS